MENKEKPPYMPPRTYVYQQQQPYVPPTPIPYRWDFSKKPSNILVPNKSFPTKIQIIQINQYIPKVRVSARAIIKMEILAAAIDLEVGWLGTAVREGDDFLAKDVFLFKQTVSGGHTEISEEALGDFASELLMRDGGEEIFNEMNSWGHSHVEGGTYPSFQDDDQMSLFQKNGKDFFLRSIINRRGEMRFDIYDWANGLIYNQAPWEEKGDAFPPDHEIAEIEQELRAEMLEKVTALKYPVYVPPKRFGRLKRYFGASTTGQNIPPQ